MTMVSQAEYARMRGVSRAAISQWKKDGKLVLQGAMVDVEASDAYLKKYRRDGLPGVKHQQPLNKQLNNQPVRLPSGEVSRRLAEMDWSRSFAWSDEAQRERARHAAQCIGWEAVESDQRDDGHWGGFQLRIPGYMSHHGGLTADAIPAGHGFELDVWDVLRICREEIEPALDTDGQPILGEDESIEVRADLLHVLARPFSENDRQAA